MIVLKYLGHRHAVGEEMTEGDVKTLRDWCDRILSCRDDFSTVLDAVAAALRGLAVGKFANASSREFWDKGFDVDSDDCTFMETDTFFAIYDPRTDEIDVNMVGEGGGCAKVNTKTGSVVML